VVAGAIREELQRAFLVDRFERHIGPVWIGVVVLSVLFGVGHLLQGVDAAIATGLLGACWAVIYVRRRSVVMPLVSHALFNSLEIVRMLGNASSL
jgi:membrane protease YdiL (CAAX protease family)